MTITPEDLWLLSARIRQDGAVDRDEVVGAIDSAAAEIKRLTRNAKHAAALEAREWGEVVQAPYDDCECRICETLRNPPPPTEALKELWRMAKGNPPKDLRK